ncbi:Protein root UVB sensitive 4 [Capsicum baccatum]|uniref:Protein root UVB sensitive 4 n=1 Tax=Capsicum baccatum TaxID=33114 RepID=A0A2G2VY46_CAPBA|nr:Protein root UVB sensitive 4 [Capsicum baccatum]
MRVDKEVVPLRELHAGIDKEINFVQIVVHIIFAIADNLGEVCAKGQIQTVFFDNLGLTLAATLNILSANNPRSSQCLLDLFGIYQGLKHVHLQTLTKVGPHSHSGPTVFLLDSLSPKVTEDLEGRLVSIRLTGLACMRGSPEKPYVVHAPLKVIGGEAQLEHASFLERIINAFNEAGLVLEEDANKKLKVDETLRDSKKLLSYLSMKKDCVDEALRMMRTMRLMKFKGSSTEMYLIRVFISHSKNFERVIIEQCNKGNAASFKEQ